MGRDWRLIGNPAAGGGRVPGIWARFARQFPDAASRSVQWTRQRGEAVELARSAAGRCEMVVAVGGDGTVNEVAAGLIEAGEHDTVLGIVPLGTGNDTARALGLEDPGRAWEALESGQARSMDVIEVRSNGRGISEVRYSLVYAAAGLAAEILEQTTARVKRWAGRRGCYTVGFLKALAKWQCPWMEVRCDGRDYRGRYTVVAAGNAEWVGGGMMRLSPGARCDDGLLNVNLIPQLNRWQALRSFPRLYRGTHLEILGVEYFAAREMELSAAPESKIQVDGDVCGKTPVRFRILPGRLRIRAPSVEAG